MRLKDGNSGLIYFIKYQKTTNYTLNYIALHI
jgi:hypothetical protein